MKNIYVILADKPSRIGRFVDTQEFILRSENDIPRGENVNIYITSDEEIKEGNWVFDSTNYGLIHKVWEVTEKHFSFKDSLHARGLKSTNRNLKCHFKKIILTTDPDLIADGVQAIDDEFLEWFAKNPNCERVDFFKLEYSEYSNSKCLKCGFIENHDKVDTEDCPKCSNTTYEHFYNQYKLIIPKEETIEEAAERITYHEELSWENTLSKRCFIDGAKWQAEQDKNKYSEEEVIELTNWYLESFLDDSIGLNGKEAEKRVNHLRGKGLTKEVIDYWFEQFKKK
jgi:ssDNA-binding Zn-finger/Zn-ribbon topoisomerase 1